MRVAIVDGDLCYPATSGKRLRSLNLLLPLARRHSITCIMRGHGNDEENRNCRMFLEAQGIEATIIDDPLPLKTGIGFYARLVANMASSLPYSVASHHSKRFAAGVREWAAGRTFDLWSVDWSGYLYAVAASGACQRPDSVEQGVSTPLILQAHNVDSLIWQRTFDMAKGAFKRWYVWRQWQKFKRHEADAFRRVHRVVFVSESDAALACEWFGIDNGDIVENGVEVAAYDAVNPSAGSRTILFLGSLDWRPNRDAVERLLRDIFPRVRSAVADAALVIVGRKPPPALTTWVRTSPGVQLHADVPDVRPYLAASGVMAVPLRIGGGSRLKILEALACGLPVVSTTVGAEGLRLRPGVEYTCADSDEELAEALIAALRRPVEAFAQAACGKQTVVRHYDWSLLAAKLERVWYSAVQEQR